MLTETQEKYFGAESYPYISEISEFYRNLKDGHTSLEEFREFLSNGYLVLLRENNHIRGYYILSLDVPEPGNDFFVKNKDAYLFHLYLAETLRNKGLGTKIIKNCEQICRENGRVRLFAETKRTNTGMSNLLGRLGYCFLQERDYRKQYNDPEGVYLLYGKVLN